MSATIHCPSCGRLTYSPRMGYWIRDCPVCRGERTSLEEFRATLETEPVDELDAAVVASVHPRPWTSRHGSGKSARIRMQIGELKYERRQGEDVWKRVDEWTMGAAL